MLDITLRQALSVWSDLESAYHGTNGYGGNVAEIYAYRLVPENPTANLHTASESNFVMEARAERAKLAAFNLEQLLTLFRELHDCKISVYGEQFVPPFEHRVHVEIRQ